MQIDTTETEYLLFTLKYQISYVEVLYKLDIFLFVMFIVVDSFRLKFDTAESIVRSESRILCQYSVISQIAENDVYSKCKHIRTILSRCSNGIIHT